MYAAGFRIGCSFKLGTSNFLPGYLIRQACPSGGFSGALSYLNLVFGASSFHGHKNHCVLHRFDLFTITSPHLLSKQFSIFPINLTNTAAMPGFAQASDLQAWQQLQQHHTTLGRNIVLKEFFEKDPSRFEKFSRTFKNTADKSEILFDFSKNFITEDTLSLLIQLAKEAGVEKLRDEMFAGEKINFTEKRAVYHVALRNVTNQPMQVDGKSVVEDVNEVLEHMKVFSEQVRSGEWKGYTGKKITTIVNVGIGGSDL